VIRPIGPGPRPPENGFANALRAARRRRLRTLGTGIACGTAAVATLAMAALPRLATGSTAGLEPAAPAVTAGPPGRAAGTAGTVSPTPSAPPAAPDAGLYGGHDGRSGTAATGAARAGGPAMAAGPAGGAAGGSAAGPAQGGVPAATRPAPPAPTSASPGESEPIVQTYEDQSVSAPCDDSTGWCLRAEVAGGDAGRTLRLHACRGPADTKGTLTFSDDAEADFTISRDGTAVWRWSWWAASEPYRHDVPVDRWQCAVWSTPWNGTGQDGGAVPPGRYTLSAVSRASELWTRTVTAAFDVS
jgi:hypothetical protein